MKTYNINSVRELSPHTRIKSIRREAHGTFVTVDGDKEIRLGAHLCQGCDMELAEADGHCERCGE